MQIIQFSQELKGKMICRRIVIPVFIPGVTTAL